ncbi:19636_t:CDS:1, partial [Gigaspora rosea]
AITSLTVEKFSQSFIKCYLLLTRNPDTQEFMFVLKHMDSNLYDYLVKTTDLTWKTKFKM